MSNIFNDIFVKKPKWSRQSLTHEWKSSTDFGNLRVFLNEDVFPGETWKVRPEIQLKFAPMIAPVMHRINLITHFFYVPWRLLWKDYDKFLAGGVNGDIDIPNIWISPSQIFDICLGIATEDGKTSGSPQSRALYGFKHSIFDTLGLPATIIEFGDSDETTHVTIGLHCLAYNKVYCEYYADETLDREYISDCDIFFSESSHLSDFSYNIYDYIESYRQYINEFDFYRLKQKAWEKDYFTSALPFSQRGPEVRIPLSGTAPVELDQNQFITIDWLNPDIKRPQISPKYGPLPEGAAYWNVTNDINNIKLGSGVDGDTGDILVKVQAYNSGGAAVGGTEWVKADDLFANADVVDAQEFRAYIRSKIKGKADLSQASAVSIETFRWLERLQMFLEKNARAGARYIEQIAVHFGVRGDDLRLSRPQFLGGATQPVQVGEVLQLSETSGNSPLGDYAGIAGARGTLDNIKGHFKEHGVIMGFCCVAPRTNYFQGIPRKFLKSDRFDYLFPEFQHLGEQEIKNAELYYNGRYETSLDPDGVFGYAPRYSEYRYIPSTIHGDFIDNLNYWTLARRFGTGATDESKPALNSEFVHIQPKSLHRVFAVEQGDAAPMWFQILNHVKTIRPITKNPIPSL